MKGGGGGGDQITNTVIEPLIVNHLFLEAKKFKMSKESGGRELRYMISMIYGLYIYLTFSPALAKCVTFEM